MKEPWNRSDKIAALSLLISTSLVIPGYFLNKEVTSIKLDVKPVLDLQPKIEIINNNITKVEKEIANINEAMEQYLGNERTELFQTRDLNNRVKIFQHPKYERGVIAYFQLQVIPDSKTVRLASELGARASSTFDVFHNIIIFRTKESPDSFLTEDRFYEIKYQPGKVSDQVYTLEGMEYKGTKESVNAASFCKQANMCVEVMGEVIK